MLDYAHIKILDSTSRLCSGTVGLCARMTRLCHQNASAPGTETDDWQTLTFGEAIWLASQTGGQAYLVISGHEEVDHQGFMSRQQILHATALQSDLGSQLKCSRGTCMTSALKRQPRNGKSTICCISTLCL